MTVSGSNRVNRGGNWNNTARNCRSANRNNDAPGNRNDNLGFRLLSTWWRQRTRFTDCARVPWPCPGYHPAPVVPAKQPQPAAFGRLWRVEDCRGAWRLGEKRLSAVIYVRKPRLCWTKRRSISRRLISCTSTDSTVMRFPVRITHAFLRCMRWSASPHEGVGSTQGCVEHLSSNSAHVVLQWTPAAGSVGAYAYSMMPGETQTTPR